MKGLCDHLIKEGFIKTQKVYDSLMRVDRADFTKNYPYADSPQSIGYNDQKKTAMKKF